MLSNLLEQDNLRFVYCNKIVLIKDAEELGMNLSTQGLVLSPDDLIDLQLHTIWSDGKWQPEQLVAYLKKENFSLAAVTDHDRVDTIVKIQQLGIQYQLPLLVASEFTTTWREQMTDILCYGFEPDNAELLKMTADIWDRQRENTQAVFEQLHGKGFEYPDSSKKSILDKPSAQQPHAIYDLMKAAGHDSEKNPAAQVLYECGITYATHDPAEVVAAIHQAGGVCLIAHPGRTDGFMTFDEVSFDEFRREIPIDGIEVYYPKHSQEQTQRFSAYAEKHRLLVSAGSDSHDSEKPPIPYPAELSRHLLERLGITIQ